MTKNQTFTNVRRVLPSYPLYLKHCAYYATQNRAGKSETESDPVRHVTDWAEHVIREQISQHPQYALDPKNIIAWQEKNHTGSFVQRFKEVDGIFNTPDGLLCIEVKASWSKNSFRKGRQQLRETVKMLQQNCRTKVQSLFIVLNCHHLNSELVNPDPMVIENWKSKQDFCLTEEHQFQPTAFQEDTPPVWLIDTEDVNHLVNIYGPPCFDPQEIDSIEY